jgi:hypothetical protein
VDVSALPVVVDLTAYRGDTWAQTFRLLEGEPSAPVDLTGASVEAEARRALVDESIVLAVSIADPPTLGEVTLGQPEGGLDCGQYEYDVEVVRGGTITTWVKGKISVEHDVTNSPGE